jgi:hypothetical protein
MLAQGRPFDASWLELVESLMLACIELAEMLRESGGENDR